MTKPQDLNICSMCMINDTMGTSGSILILVSPRGIVLFVLLNVPFMQYKFTIWNVRFVHYLFKNILSQTLVKVSQHQTILHFIAGINDSMKCYS